MKKNSFSRNLAKITVGATLLLAIVLAGAWLSKPILPTAHKIGPHQSSQESRSRSIPARANPIAGVNLASSFRPSTKEDPSGPDAKAVAPLDWTPTFHRLSRKALMTPDEQANYHKMLSDPRVFSEAKARLLNQVGNEPATQEERIRLVDAFTAALKWRNNPIRSTVVTYTHEVLESEEYLHTNGDRELARAMVGDKLEILSNVNQLDRELYEGLVAKLKLLPNHKWLDFATTGVVPQSKG